MNEYEQLRTWLRSMAGAEQGDRTLTIRDSQAASRSLAFAVNLAQNDHAEVVVWGATKLPFAAHSFDQVSLIPGARWELQRNETLRESARVLGRRGWLAIGTWTVPGGSKKRDRQAGEWINAFLHLQDPGRVDYINRFAWHRALFEAGFQIEAEEQVVQRLQLDAWVHKRSPADRIRIQAMLRQAPAPVAAVLTPEIAGDRITLCLTGSLFLARRI